MKSFQTLEKPYRKNEKNQFDKGHKGTILYLKIELDLTIRFYSCHVFQIP